MSGNDELLLQTARLYSKHNGSIIACARELEIARTTMQSRVETARSKGYIREEIYVAKDEEDLKKVYLKPHYKIYQRPKSHDVTARVLAIGDSHDGPDIPDKSRFFAMGEYCAQNEIDQVIQIGDLASLDSMSSHDQNWTLKGQQKPSFKEDLESLEQALIAFDNGLSGHECQKHITLGNHEDRIARFVNNNPEMSELLFERLYELLEFYEWTYSPFGEFYFVGDVGFTHVPLNAMGKPYGGISSENQIARDSLHDVVYGHTHKRVDKTFPKIGHEFITIVNLGCSLPSGHVEDYARHSVTGWSYGVYDMTIRNGRIQESTWITMDRLMREYSNA